MNKYLGKHKLLKKNTRRNEILNIPITSKEMS